MQVIVDNLLVTYERHGKMGRPVLLVLHGWADSSQNWLSFSEHFAGRYEVITVDLPGFGRTDMPPQPWGLDDYGCFVGHFLAKIGVTLYGIVGHSNGGAIAIRGLANGDLRAEKLVLLASAGVRSTYNGRKKAIRLITKTGKALAAPLPGRVKDQLRRKLYTTVGSDMLIAERLQETFKRVVGDDVQADAARLTTLNTSGIPVLLIYGEHDVSTPPNWGRLLHEHIQGSTFELLGNAGHFVYQDQPEKVAQLVEDFLK